MATQANTENGFQDERQREHEFYRQVFENELGVP